MIYNLEVAFIVAAPVFALAGIFIAALYVWIHGVEYAHRALRATHRVATPVHRESFTISRRNSRNHDIDAVHVA